MKAKRFLAVLMSVCMVLAMCVCGSAESGEADAKETVATAKTADEKNEASKDEATDTAWQENETEEVNEWGFTQSQLQEVYDSIAKSITEECLEPNQIAPEDFALPSKDSASWSYLVELIQQFQIKKFSDKDVEIAVSANESEKDTIEAIFNGIVNWLDLQEPYDLAYYSKLVKSISPFEEMIPQNVDLTKAAENETE